MIRRMDHTLALIQQVHEGDKRAREQLVEENMGLVFAVARRFRERGCEKEDLIQLGCIGLLKAIDHFDTSYDVCFSTYAVPMITGEIRRFLRDDGMIKVSRLHKEAAARAGRAKEALEKEKGTEPTVEEIAGRTGLSPEELVMALEAVSEVESLSQPIYRGDGPPVLLADRLPDRKDRNEELLNRMLLTQLLERLEEKEREIIRMRYFQDQTQTQVAKRLGMTQVQVSRAEKKILRKMRQQVKL